MVCAPAFIFDFSDLRRGDDDDDDDDDGDDDNDGGWCRNHRPPRKLISRNADKYLRGTSSLTRPGRRTSASGAGAESVVAEIPVPFPGSGVRRSYTRNAEDFLITIVNLTGARKRVHRLPP